MAVRAVSGRRLVAPNGIVTSAAVAGTRLKLTDVVRSAASSGLRLSAVAAASGRLMRVGM